MHNRLKVWLKGKIFLLFLIGSIIFAVYIVGAEKFITSVRTIDLVVCEKIPENWTETSHREHYVGNELVEYINGGAELYLAYGFKQAYIKEYRNDVGKNLTVEVYEMDRSENSYGVYSFDTDGEHLDIGCEATYAYGLLKFWKGRFFIRIISDSEDEETKNTILFCGTQIADKIHNKGKKPAILSILPAERASIKNVRYFHTNTCLSNFYYLSDENILGLNSETEAVIYEYKVGSQLLRVVLIQYLETEYAEAAYLNFINSYFFDESIQDPDIRITSEYIGEVEGEKYTGIRRSGGSLILVFECDDSNACKKMLDLQYARL